MSSKFQWFTLSKFISSLKIQVCNEHFPCKTAKEKGYQKNGKNLVKISFIYKTIPQIFSGTTAESFVDHLKRSASTVNPKNRPAPIAKPIRRSKSQRSQNFVTSIQHGGSVTLVSLNGDLDQENSSGKPNEIKHVHHHHFVQDWDGNGIHPGGSQTLPNRKSGQFYTIKCFLVVIFKEPVIQQGSC